jgi:RNA polymerase sigma-70 factor, ECF subfamily
MRRLGRTALVIALNPPVSRFDGWCFVTAALEQSSAEEASDAQLLGLVAQVAAGNKEALGEIYRRLGPRSLALAKRILGDRASSEELIHDAFLEVWRRASEFQPERGCVRAWVYTIVRSRALDRLRRRKQGIRLTSHLAQTSQEEHPTPLDQHVAEETNAHLRAMIAEVPKEQRQLLELAYFEGLSHSLIAERTGQPLGTVKTRIRAAMAQLMAQRGRISEAS